MKGMPFGFQGDGCLEIAAAKNLNWSRAAGFSSSKRKHQQQQEEREGIEPCSVLDNTRSPSPPTSSSTLSSSLAGGGGGGSSDSAGVAAISDNNPDSTTTTTHKWQQQPASNTGASDKNKEEWAFELQPIHPSSLAHPKCGGGGLDEWEAVLSESAAAGSPSNHEQTFLRWIMGDIDDSKPHHHQQPMAAAQPAPPIQQEFEPFGGLIDPFFGSFEGQSAIVPPPTLLSPNQNARVPISPPAPTHHPMFFHEPVDEKPHHHHLFNNNNPGLVINHHHPPQNPSFFLPSPPQPENLILPPNPKRHHSLMPSSAPGAAGSVPYGFQHRPPAKPKDEAAAAVAIAQQQQQALVDQLLKAAELVEAGNPFSAREILARLNQHIPTSPLGLKPLFRSAFLFKDVLALLANSPAGSQTPTAATPLTNPWDVVLKLSSYKAFSEVSPLIHFANFTVTQTLLEETCGSDRIHIVDFDIGVGGQWPSFMQELAHRRSPSMPLLKITAFVSPSSFHPLELHLTRDNLSHFAAELGIPFKLAFVNIDSFNPAEILAVSANETIAVNIPVGSHYPQPFPSLLRLVKQLSPKIVVSVDQMCDRGDLPFSHHFLHSFQSCMVLLDSIDAAGTNADMANKIERFLVQPRIESAVAGRHRAANNLLPPWRALFASAGFVPSQFSNFTETQAECLLKRVQVRGFHVEKRQASLFLYWQRGELGSVSAWKC